MKSTILFSALILAAAGLSFKAADLQSKVHPVQATEGLEAHEEAAGASILGQFRASSASWLYLHTDLYLHNGVQMRPLTKSEQDSGVQAEHSAESEKELDHEGQLVTAIPSADRDFIGIVGEMERKRNSYRDMKNHTHNSPIDTLPLYRLMTWSDPHFLEGWTQGATILAWKNTDEGVREALAFIDEGLQENPKRPELVVEKAQILIEHGRRLDEAMPMLVEAITTHRKQLDQATSSEKEALTQCYRWLALCFKDKGDLARAKAVANEGHRLFKDDVGLTHLVQVL